MMWPNSKALFVHRERRMNLAVLRRIKKKRQTTCLGKWDKSTNVNSEKTNSFGSLSSIPKFQNYFSFCCSAPASDRRRPREVVTV